VLLRLTQLFNITGHPAIAIPCGRGADGMPRSIQLVGHRGSTERLIQVALAVERTVTGTARELS
jgi:Asp-tRNA(Asn)/Glu-tRNA(Gln) amidotransferase A subunit family amidase